MGYNSNMTDTRTKNKRDQRSLFFGRKIATGGGWTLIRITRCLICLEFTRGPAADQTGTVRIFRLPFRLRHVLQTTVLYLCQPGEIIKRVQLNQMHGKLESGGELAITPRVRNFCCWIKLFLLLFLPLLVHLCSFFVDGQLTEIISFNEGTRFG